MTSKQKHTPGPWIVGNNGVDVHRANAEFTEICTAFNKANARLIAAAPEYASEMQEAIGWLDALLKTKPKNANEIYEILTIMHDRFVKLNDKATGGEE